MAEKGTITKLLEKKLNDYDALSSEKDPEKIYAFLLDRSQFKTLSAQLKETMIVAGICTASSSQSEFVHTLYERLVNLNCPKIPTIKTVREWFSGKTLSIKYRSTAIKICFALNLDIDLSTQFLTKIGHHIFNIRDGADAIYMYCLLNQRPYSVSQELLEKYFKHDSSKSNPIYTQKDYLHHSGLTTNLLTQKLLEDSSWETDEEFLNTFLLPNKNKFIGYATTSIYEYYRLKNNLYLTVCMRSVEEEKSSVNQRNYNDNDLIITQKDIPISLAVRSALRKIDSSSILYGAKISMHEDMSNTGDALMLIRDILADNPPLAVQKELSLFFNDIIATEGLLKKVLTSIVNCGQKRHPLFTDINESNKRKGSTENDIPLEVLSDITNLFSSDSLFSNKNLNTIKEKRDIAIALVYYVYGLSLDQIQQLKMCNYDPIRNRLIYVTGEEILPDIRQTAIASAISPLHATDIANKAIRTYLESKGIGRLRKRTESELSDTVFKEFPDDKTFSSFEKNPDIIQKNMSVRKAIILMFFISYAYELPIYISDYRFKSFQFETMGFYEFIDDLNGILTECRLPKLYVGNQFDFLILRSIQQIELSDEESSDDDSSVLSFFNRVLAFSFPQ